MRHIGSLAVAAGLAIACTRTAAPPVTQLVIIEPAAGAVVASSPVTVRGSAPANAEITRDISFLPDDHTVADGQGLWSMSVDLDAGENVLTFRIGDDASTARSISVTLRSAAATAPPAPPRTSGPTTRPPANVPDNFAELSKRAWQQLVKAPDDHISEAYVVWACITQFDSATGSDTFRADASYQNEHDDFWLEGDNALFEGDSGELADFVKDDIVRAEVLVLGSNTYETTIGGSQTVPAFYIWSIESRGSCEL